MTRPKTLEARLAEHLRMPGTFVTAAQRQFIDDLRRAAEHGVGYGWMQQVIEWEWQSAGPGSLGPEYYEKRITELERRLNDALTPPATSSPQEPA